MSGGFYDYVRLSAIQLQNRLEEMERDALANDDIPDKVGEEFYNMRKSLNPEIMREFELYMSGDNSTETFLDNFESLK